MIFTCFRVAGFGGASYATAEIAGYPIAVIVAGLLLVALVVLCATILIISLVQRQVPDVTIGRARLQFRSLNRDDEDGAA